MRRTSHNIIIKFSRSVFFVCVQEMQEDQREQQKEEKKEKNQAVNHNLVALTIIFLYFLSFIWSIDLPTPWLLILTTTIIILQTRTYNLYSMRCISILLNKSNR